MPGKHGVGGVVVDRGISTRKEDPVQTTKPLLELIFREIKGEWDDASPRRFQPFDIGRWKERGAVLRQLGKGGGGWFGEDTDDRSIVEGGSSSSTGDGQKEHQNREQKGTAALG